MRHRSITALVVVIVAVSSACGSDKKSGAPKTTNEGELIAQVASYDIAARRPLRILVGLQTGEQLVSYGRAQLLFARDGGSSKDSPSLKVAGDWTPVSGQQLPATLPDTPRLGGAAQGVGLYAATVTFDQPGSWRVRAEVEIDGAKKSGSSTFTVAEKPIEVSVGDTAPATENRLPGTNPPTAVDSRASDGTVPDPELHGMTVADAITNGRPTMVVISTPVYCVSRFCGPITDTVATLARSNAETMNFVHLEVWKDFERRQVNKGAADWIYREGSTDLDEPWVYVVDRDGRVVERFDNVASDDELSSAVESATRP